MKTGKFIFKANGEVEIELSGYGDDSCLKETEAIERAIGRVKQRTRKREASVRSMVKEQSRERLT